MKPGSVPGPVRIKPNKKGDLTDYRRAKRVQDYVNSQLAKGIPPEFISTTIWSMPDKPEGS